MVINKLQYYTVKGDKGLEMWVYEQERDSGSQNEVLEVRRVVDGHQLHGFLQILSLNAS